MQNPQNPYLGKIFRYSLSHGTTLHYQWINIQNILLMYNKYHNSQLSTSLNEPGLCFVILFPACLSFGPLRHTSSCNLIGNHKIQYSDLSKCKRITSPSMNLSLLLLYYQPHLNLSSVGNLTICPKINKGYALSIHFPEIYQGYTPNYIEMGS